MKKIFALLTLVLLLATPAMATGNKFVADSVLDAALAKIATSTRMTACTALPANFAGIAAVVKANEVLTAGVGNGDYTLADGDVSGRKLTVLAQTALTMTGNGTVTHLCLDDGTVLQACSPLGTNKSIVDYTTEVWDTAAFDIEFADVTQ
jgi:hypothetical protein